MRDQVQRHLSTGLHRQGLTLIELLMVVGIIIVLVALLMPALKAVREGGRKLTCISNLRQIGMAFLGYTGDNRGHLPFNCMQLGTGQTGQDKKQLEFMLAPYFGGRQDAGGADYLFTGISQLKTWVCPSSPIVGYAPWGPVGDPDPKGVQYRYRDGKVGLVNAYEGAFQYLHWYKLNSSDLYPAVAYVTLQRLSNVSRVPFHFCSNRWQASAPDPSLPDWWYGCQGISWHPKGVRPTGFLDGHVIAMVRSPYILGQGQPDGQSLLITPQNFRTYASEEY